MEAVLAQKSAVAEREKTVFTAKHTAQKIEKQLLVSPEHKTVNAALRRVCFMLHEIVQRYVPNTPHTFDDYNKLVNCTKLLQEMGLKPAIAVKLKTAVDNAADETVLNSFEYRHLRNKIMASLSVIADLTERATGAGSVDYQKGMREGYRRASDIAVMFLEDISGEDQWMQT